MIGREREKHELLRCYQSEKAELVAIYGRRRVGKTYLVNETFRERITFHHAGLSPVEGNRSGLLKEQLEHFYYSLLMQGMKRSHRPASWLEAFFMLEQLLVQLDDGSRQIVFLDELPWLDTPRSGFITAFEGFWNNWGCSRHNLMVIVCGSANSWILNKLINNHGGLYNRVTCQIKLEPFTLRECEQFFSDAGIRLSRYDIAQSYMIVGGIPYYMDYFEKGLSLAQDVDKLFFEKNASLHDEFDRLFSSVFTNPDMMKAIVAFLDTRRSGYTLQEISKGLKITVNGKLSENLRALIASDFIVNYCPFGHSKRETYYKLVDPFCIFWLRFVRDGNGLEENFWQASQATPSVVSWRGLAFELVCFNHIKQIKAALGISGVRSSCSAWMKKSDAAGEKQIEGTQIEGTQTEGTQIDLLIDRSDNVLNVCEIKFSGSEFKVDKSYYRVLLRRQELLMSTVSPKSSIHNTLITTFGLAYNEYSGIFTNVITLDQLFAN